jgi:ribosome-associated protein
MAAMDAESIRSEIAFRFSRSSGPGGQHAQKSSTRAEALFDVEESAGLTESERKRVLGKLGPVVRAIAQDERSQLRNRELATERILEQLREAVKVRRKRTATKPTAASKERRLEEKKRRGRTKRLRQTGDDER